ncbi:phosphate acyltransferase [Neorhizobium galegae]|uniref:phosphate acyltransferase n=1 Tax=Neorhizobium galegae TaxID=399 RepID=UPI000621EDB8|nr:phosphate acyltransferase [Neorhizobium galegae]KAB1127291.1 hypothetical protein F4V90_07680 [Neorhizobium galegae]CDZ57142.1 Hypothetical protein NGAL_HAMBI2566_16950 [Neorhizobium galegae bv. orientalis]
MLRHHGRYEAIIRQAISLPAMRAAVVAGQADILLVPDLETGNMLAKQLIYFARTVSAGLVLGAEVPIILTSHADPAKVRTTSAALAKLAAAKRLEARMPL